MNADTAALSQERDADAWWAQHDPEVERLYGGEWVVPFQRRIVTHGPDARVALEEAARLTGEPVETLLVCAVPLTRSWLAD